MPSVLGNYLPIPSFTAPRSYLYDVDIALYGDTITQTGNVFLIHATPPDPTFITLEFWDLWWTWNSKSYQLSEIVKNFYYQTPPSPTLTALPFDLGYWYNPTTRRPGLFLNWYVGLRLPRIAPLPPSPSNYWLPRPL